ncbi:MAG: DNA helicase RecQ [Phycisphaeraceae bacterium]|nr:DNA helicase RecQ [Phycisphaeraceae bacterium]
MEPRAEPIRETGSVDLNLLLKQQFGHNTFRPMQRQIIDDTIAGRDAFVLMPTGGGKSLCYQMPALVREGTTIVVSPLIALMEDQLTALQANGVQATVLNSSVAYREIVERESAAAAGRYDLIYMAPERLMSSSGQRLLGRMQVGHFAIDEAHCISEWGHDFRPEYRMLGALRRAYPDTPITALTATATPRVAEDIVDQLDLRDARIYRGSFERDNLYYEARPKQKVMEQVETYLDANPEHEGIIYCHSRAAVERAAERLRGRGIAALPYHAGLSGDVRARHQHDFVYGQARVIVATLAFGMGVDKPDVRFVVHADLPRNLESYYQETGRAGRDGQPSDCILFFSHGDRMKIESFIDMKPDEQERQVARRQLRQMIDFAYATECRCRPLLAYFGQDHVGDCGHCDNCRMPPNAVDATQDARKLLSAVTRTGQRFGLGHVIDVLRGVETERVERNGHGTLSVFGVGRDQTKGYWRRVAETLIHREELAVTRDEYPTAHFTEASRPVLVGEVPVEVTLPRVERRSKKTRAPVVDEGPIDHELFEQLRRLRREIAEQQNVPPYVVFSDASLKQMAARHPTTPEAFLEITGVGRHKLERYGEAFMSRIRETS